MKKLSLPVTEFLHSTRHFCILVFYFITPFHNIVIIVSFSFFVNNL